MTLAESLLALTIVGILGALAVPEARRGLDTVKVRGARETAFGVAARTRTVALAHGGADFVVDLNGKSASIVNAAGSTIATVSFADYGIDILAAGATARVVLHYDSRGIGRMASQTLRFRRGDAEAGLTFSSYGRVRRW